MGAGRYQEEIPGTEFPVAKQHLTGDTLENGEPGFLVGTPGLVQNPAIHLEVLAMHDSFTRYPVQLWFKVGKVNRLQTLGNVQLTRLAIEPRPVPVEDAVSCVAVLLNLEQDISSVDGMQPTAGNKQKRVCKSLDAVN